MNENAEIYLGSSETRERCPTLPALDTGIPEEVRERFGIEQGDKLVWVKQNGEIKVKVIG